MALWSVCGTFVFALFHCLSTFYNIYCLVGLCWLRGPTGPDGPGSGFPHCLTWTQFHRFLPLIECLPQSERRRGKKQQIMVSWEPSGHWAAQPSRVNVVFGSWDAPRHTWCNLKVWRSSSSLMDTVFILRVYILIKRNIVLIHLYLVTVQDKLTIIKVMR